MIELYYTPTSCSLAAHIALREAEAEYRLNLVKLWKSEEHEIFKQINPLGTVPAVKIDTTVLTENVAIMTYIASLYPEKKLMPEGQLEIAECTAYMCWLSSSVQIARRQFRAPQRFSTEARSYESISSNGRDKFLGFLELIENRLEDRQWVMGEHYTVADGYLLVFFAWALSDQIEMSRYKYFSEFKERMLTRGAVRQALEYEKNILVQL